MVSRMARCSARTFSGPSAASSASISSRATATADADRCCAGRAEEYAAAARPTIRPKTSSSISELPPRRFAPCSPEEASPMA